MFKRSVEFRVSVVYFWVLCPMSPSSFCFEEETLVKVQVEMNLELNWFSLFVVLKLALRAGNEKEEGETADTVGCCSLRVEHITLHDQLDVSECVVEFDFLGKDSIRYYNKVPVIKKVKQLEINFSY